MVVKIVRRIQRDVIYIWGNKQKKVFPQRFLGLKKKKKKKPVSQIRKAWRMRQEFTLIFRI